jgi:hypothetical protein
MDVQQDLRESEALVTSLRQQLDASRASAEHSKKEVALMSKKWAVGHCWALLGTAGHCWALLGSQVTGLSLYHAHGGSATECVCG